MYDGLFAGIFVGCSVTYVRYQMNKLLIFMHEIIHIRMTYLTNMRYIFYVVKSGVCSRQKGFHTQCTSAVGMKYIYTSRSSLLIIFSLFIIIWCLMDSEYIEPTKAKKFVMLLPWWRIEAEYNHAVKKISENVSTTRLGVEISKFRVLYCVCHIKCFAEMKLMESGDQDVKGPGLGSHPV